MSELQWFVVPPWDPLDMFAAPCLFCTDGVWEARRWLWYSSEVSASDWWHVMALVCEEMAHMVRTRSV